MEETAVENRPNNGRCDKLCFAELDVPYMTLPRCEHLFLLPLFHHGILHCGQRKHSRQCAYSSRCPQHERISGASRWAIFSSSNLVANVVLVLVQILSDRMSRTKPCTILQKSTQKATVTMGHALESRRSSKNGLRIGSQSLWSD